MPVKLRIATLEEKRKNNKDINQDYHINPKSGNLILVKKSSKVGKSFTMLQEEIELPKKIKFVNLNTDYLDLSPVRFLKNTTYGMLEPDRQKKPPQIRKFKKTPLLSRHQKLDMSKPDKQSTPPQVRKFKKTPLLSKHQKLDKVIMKKKGKLVQTTLEGKKTNAPPPKRGYTKKGKDAKPTKQGKIVSFTTKDGKKVAFKPKQKNVKEGCRSVKFTACN